MELHAATDGVVTLRSPAAGDRDLLIAGRDEEFRRWLGPGSDDPRPTACVVVDGEVVGWIDYETDRSWLDGDAVNLGYALFPAARRQGFATRALVLLLQELAEQTEHEHATVLIDPANARSIAVAHRAGFRESGHVDGQVLLSRPIRE